MSRAEHDETTTAYAALIAADRAQVAPPDLAALRAGGRRRLRRRRLAVGAGVAAVAAVLVIPVAVLGGDDRAAPDVPVVSDPPSSPAASPTYHRPEQGSVDVPGGRVRGQYENGTLLGDPLVLGRLGGQQEILYAMRGPGLEPPGRGGPVDYTYVSTGVRDGSRVLRLGGVISLRGDDNADGIELYDGARIDGFAGRAPYYRVMGTVRGDVEVTVTGPDGVARPVTGSSTTMVPGYTVFYDQAPWDESWDPLQLAPLTISTDDDRSVQVRERSYSG